MNENIMNEGYETTEEETTELECCDTKEESSVLPVLVGGALIFTGGAAAYKWVISPLAKKVKDWRAKRKLEKSGEAQDEVEVEEPEEVIDEKDIEFIDPNEEK